MLFTSKQFIEAEYRAFTNKESLKINNNLAQTFTPTINNESYNIRKFINRMKKEVALMTAIQDEVTKLPSIAKKCEKGRVDVGMVNKVISEKEYMKNEQRALYKDLTNWGITPNIQMNFEKFPALRIMSYSQFMRVHFTQKEIKPNDVMDVLISSAVPYVDAVLTENYQVDIYLKAKKYID